MKIVLVINLDQEFFGIISSFNHNIVYLRSSLLISFLNSNGLQNISLTYTLAPVDPWCDWCVLNWYTTFSRSSNKESQRKTFNKKYQAGLELKKSVYYKKFDRVVFKCYLERRLGKYFTLSGLGKRNIESLFILIT